MMKEVAAPQRLTIDAAVLDRVNAALDDVRAGKMVILVDDEDRENEGDLTLAADLVTPEAINFMARFGRGLICLALDEAQIDRLDLPMMKAPGRGSPPLGTAFTVAIEAASGVTTGISAADRAHTIRVATNKDAKPNDVVSPGHVFPLKARRGGVLVRTGQTEGAVDLARLAGFSSAGVICEIMKDDGTMARMPDLELFAKEHELRILSIADLIQYRLQTETLVERVEEHDVQVQQTGTTWRGIVFEVLVEDRQAFALVKGDIGPEDEVLCRVHGGSILGDLFADDTVRRSIDRIEAEGKGVLLYLASQKDLGEELAAIGAQLTPSLHAVPKPVESVPNVDALDGRTSRRLRQTLRRFGLGAQILSDLGVRKLRLLSDTKRKLAGLTGYGLRIVERVPLTDEE